MDNRDCSLFLGSRDPNETNENDAGGKGSRDLVAQSAVLDRNSCKLSDKCPLMIQSLLLV